VIERKRIGDGREKERERERERAGTQMQRMRKGQRRALGPDGSERDGVSEPEECFSR